MLVNNFYEEPSLKPSHQLSAVYHSQCARYGHIFFIKTIHNVVGEVQLKIPADQVTNSPFMWFSICPCTQAFRCDFQLVLTDSSLKINKKKKKTNPHDTRPWCFSLLQPTNKDAPCSIFQRTYPTT